jgi:hypothetical protein
VDCRKAGQIQGAETGMTESQCFEFYAHCIIGIFYRQHAKDGYWKDPTTYRCRGDAKTGQAESQVVDMGEEDLDRFRNSRKHIFRDRDRDRDRSVIRPPYDLRRNACNAKTPISAQCSW